MTRLTQRPFHQSECPSENPGTTPLYTASIAVQVTLFFHCVWLHKMGFLMLPVSWLVSVPTYEPQSCIVRLGLDSGPVQCVLHAVQLWMNIYEPFCSGRYIECNMLVCLPTCLQCTTYWSHIKTTNLEQQREPQTKHLNIRQQGQISVFSTVCHLCVVKSMFN